MKKIFLGYGMTLFKKGIPIFGDTVHANFWDSSHSRASPSFIENQAKKSTLRACAISRKYYESVFVCKKSVSALFPVKFLSFCEISMKFDRHFRQLNTHSMIFRQKNRWQFDWSSTKFEGYMEYPYINISPYLSTHEFPTNSYKSADLSDGRAWEITTEITNTNSDTTMQPKPLKPQLKPKPLKSNPLILKGSQPPSLQAFRTQISEFASQNCIISCFKGIQSVFSGV